MAEKIALQKVKIGYCVDCGREYTIDNFYESKAKFLGKAGVIPYCKDCCEEIFKAYLGLKGTLEGALYYTCAKLDIPFIRKVYEKTIEFKDDYLKKNEKKSEIDLKIFQYYYNFLWGNKSIQKVDDIWECFADSDVSLNEIESAKKSEEALKQDYEKFELDWGKQSVEDYQFLEYRYSIYTDGKVINPAQDTLYRSLCKAELRKRKKEAQADTLNDKDLGESVKEETEMIMKLMDKLKISNFSEVKEKSNVEMVIERQIWEHENTDPCELVDREVYKDYCDIGKKWGEQVIRCVKNLVGGTREYPDINKDPKEW